MNSFTRFAIVSVGLVALQARVHAQHRNTGNHVEAYAAQSIADFHDTLENRHDELYNDSLFGHEDRHLFAKKKYRSTTYSKSTNLRPTYPVSKFPLCKGKSCWRRLVVPYATQSFKPKKPAGYYGGKHAPVMAKKAPAKYTPVSKRPVAKKGHVSKMPVAKKMPITVSKAPLCKGKHCRYLLAKKKGYYRPTYSKKAVAVTKKQPVVINKKQPVTKQAPVACKGKGCRYLLAKKKGFYRPTYSKKAVAVPVTTKRPVVISKKQPVVQKQAPLACKGKGCRYLLAKKKGYYRPTYSKKAVAVPVTKKRPVVISKRQPIVSKQAPVACKGKGCRYLLAKKKGYYRPTYSKKAVAVPVTKQRPVVVSKKQPVVRKQAPLACKGKGCRYLLAKKKGYYRPTYSKKALTVPVAAKRPVVINKKQPTVCQGKGCWYL